MIETPYFRNLKKWREENGFVTEEWQVYVEASVFQDLVRYVFLVTICLLLGWKLAMTYLNP